MDAPACDTLSPAAWEEERQDLSLKRPGLGSDTLTQSDTGGEVFIQNAGIPGKGNTSRLLSPRWGCRWLEMGERWGWRDRWRGRRTRNWEGYGGSHLTSALLVQGPREKDGATRSTQRAEAPSRAGGGHSPSSPKQQAWTWWWGGPPCTWAALGSFTHSLRCCPVSGSVTGTDDKVPVFMGQRS